MIIPVWFVRPERYGGAPEHQVSHHGGRVVKVSASVCSQADKAQKRRMLLFKPIPKGVPTQTGGRITNRAAFSPQRAHLNRIVADRSEPAPHSFTIAGPSTVLAEPAGT